MNPGMVRHRAYGGQGNTQGVAGTHPGAKTIDLAFRLPIHEFAYRAREKSVKNTVGHESATGNGLIAPSVPPPHTLHATTGTVDGGPKPSGHQVLALLESSSPSRIELCGPNQG